MKHLLVAFVLFIVQALITPMASGQVERAEAEYVRSAAMAKLGTFLARIPPGQESAYGFNSRSEFTEATPGEPYQMFTLAFDGGQSSAGPSLQPMNEWRVPVCVRGEFRALLTVTRDHDRWKAVDFGAALLARELAEYEQQYRGSPGEQRRSILRLFASGCDLVLTYDRVATLDAARVTPLSSARQALARQGLPDVDQLLVRESLPLLLRLASTSEALRK